MEKQHIEEVLKHAYSILGFSESEATSVLNGLAKAQQLAVAAELIDDMSADEAKAFGILMQGADDERKTLLDRFVKPRLVDEGFKSRMHAVTSKVLDEHVVYLKTRGDSNQKAAIAKLLAAL